MIIDNLINSNYKIVIIEFLNSLNEFQFNYFNQYINFLKSKYQLFNVFFFYDQYNAFNITNLINRLDFVNSILSNCVDRYLIFYLTDAYENEPIYRKLEKTIESLGFSSNYLLPLVTKTTDAVYYYYVDKTVIANNNFNPDLFMLEGKVVTTVTETRSDAITSVYGSPFIPEWGYFKDEDEFITVVKYQDDQVAIDSDKIFVNSDKPFRFLIIYCVDEGSADLFYNLAFNDNIQLPSQVNLNKGINLIDLGQTVALKSKIVKSDEDVMSDKIYFEYGSQSTVSNYYSYTVNYSSNSYKNSYAAIGMHGFILIKTEGAYDISFGVLLNSLINNPNTRLNFSRGTFQVGPLYSYFTSAEYRRFFNSAIINETIFPSGYRIKGEKSATCLVPLDLFQYFLPALPTTDIELISKNNNFQIFYLRSIPDKLSYKIKSDKDNYNPIIFKLAYDYASFLYNEPTIRWIPKSSVAGYNGFFEYDTFTSTNLAACTPLLSRYFASNGNSDEMMWYFNRFKGTLTTYYDLYNWDVGVVNCSTNIANKYPILSIVTDTNDQIRFENRPIQLNYNGVVTGDFSDWYLLYETLLIDNNQTQGNYQYLKKFQESQTVDGFEFATFFYKQTETIELPLYHSYFNSYLPTNTKRALPPDIHGINNLEKLVYELIDNERGVFDAMFEEFQWFVINYVDWIDPLTITSRLFTCPHCLQRGSRFIQKGANFDDWIIKCQNGLTRPESELLRTPLSLRPALDLTKQENKMKLWKIFYGVYRDIVLNQKIQFTIKKTVYDPISNEYNHNEYIRSFDKLPNTYSFTFPTSTELLNHQSLKTTAFSIKISFPEGMKKIFLHGHVNPPSAYNLNYYNPNRKMIARTIDFSKAFTSADNLSYSYWNKPEMIKFNDYLIDPLEPQLYLGMQYIPQIGNFSLNKTFSNGYRVYTPTFPNAARSVSFPVFNTGYEAYQSQYTITLGTQNFNNSLQSNTGYQWNTIIEHLRWRPVYLYVSEYGTTDPLSEVYKTPDTWLRLNELNRIEKPYYPYGKPLVSQSVTHPKMGFAPYFTVYVQLAFPDNPNVANFFGLSATTDIAVVTLLYRRLKPVISQANLLFNTQAPKFEILPWESSQINISNNITDFRLEDERLKQLNIYLDPIVSSFPKLSWILQNSSMYSLSTDSNWGLNSWRWYEAANPGKYVHGAIIPFDSYEEVIFSSDKIISNSQILVGIDSVPNSAFNAMEFIFRFIELDEPFQVYTINLNTDNGEQLLYGGKQIGRLFSYIQRTIGPDQNTNMSLLIDLGSNTNDLEKENFKIFYRLLPGLPEPPEPVPVLKFPGVKLKLNSNIISTVFLAKEYIVGNKIMNLVDNSLESLNAHWIINVNKNNKNFEAYNYTKFVWAPNNLSWDKVIQTNMANTTIEMAYKYQYDLNLINTSALVYDRENLIECMTIEKSLFDIRRHFEIGYFIKTVIELKIDYWEDDVINGITVKRNKIAIKIPDSIISDRNDFIIDVIHPFRKRSEIQVYTNTTITCEQYNLSYFCSKVNRSYFISKRIENFDHIFVKSEYPAVQYKYFLYTV